MSPTGSDELNDGISAPLATIQRGIYYADGGDGGAVAGTYKGGADVRPLTTQMGFTGRRSATAISQRLHGEEDHGGWAWACNSGL